MAGPFSRIPADVPKVRAHLLHAVTVPLYEDLSFFNTKKLCGADMDMDMLQLCSGMLTHGIDAGRHENETRIYVAMNAYTMESFAWNVFGVSSECFDV